MKYKSVFDIIGPVMVGPSSSHTAGAARIGRAARNLFGKEPTWAEIIFYGSFAKTYQGHGTDVAIVAGILDFDTANENIRHSIEIATEKGIKLLFSEEDVAVDHPNTVRIKMGNETESIELVGISIGGGKVEITELNGFDLHLSGNHPAILIMHNDRFGAIASVTQILAKHEINIGRMEVSRKDIGKEALMVIELDQNIERSIENELAAAKHILHISKIVD
ncbi:L-serine dehydratase, beta chain [Paraliobacillus sp. PM-2]|uniref:L-serine ammonia-lyase, iron-sulfur-dependent subunit beta n=1 Tax=Paraliobacillus sp. PM-2 TaxID=1462524 RepID=UPI00061CA8D4|nr:L-serine ammonia-lyase, iron-sulfur-dependent subunit beta [Paraliobacillus sp. PM-2]CQR47736.1 L-serine dehydratase, beta chain [Paraliobacillus sp. PM-2]